MLKKTIIFHFIVTLLGLVASYLATKSLNISLSYLLGCAVVFVSLGSHFWAWHQIMIAERAVVWAVFAIIAKYGFLGVVLFKATNVWPINQLFFMFGLLTLLVSLGYLAYLSSVKQR